MLSHSQIWSAIEALASRHKLSPSGLARLAGLDPTSFNKSKRQASDGRLRWPSTESLAKIMDATQTSFDEFAQMASGRDGPNNGASKDQFPVGDYPDKYPDGKSGIPLLGFAEAGAGGYFDDAGFPAGQGWEQVQFPDHPTHGGNVFALEVHGQSMTPLYRDGDILIVEPSAPLRKGDRVVVKTSKGEVMAKTLERQTSSTIELTSLNPDHPGHKFDLKDLDWIARIIWASQ